MKQLLQQGDTVIATARSGGSATALQQLAASSGSQLHITDLDTAKPESIQSWAAEVQQKTGHVDVSRGPGAALHGCMSAERAAAPAAGVRPGVTGRRAQPAGQRRPLFPCACAAAD